MACQLLWHWTQCTYYYYYYSAFGLLRLPFTPGPLFSSFLVIFPVPLIQSHFQLLFSSFLGDERKETLARTCLLFCSVFCPCSLLLSYYSSPGFTDQGSSCFRFFFVCRSLSVSASSLLSCQAEIALSLGLISYPQLMRFGSRGPRVLAVSLGYVTEMHRSRRPGKAP